jgi:hypothetical protein
MGTTDNNTLGWAAVMAPSFLMLDAILLPALWAAPSRSSSIHR